MLKVMNKKIVICPGCYSKISCEGEQDQTVKVNCPNCGKSGSITFNIESKELEFYPLNEPYAYAKILRNQETLEKSYKLIEPYLNNEEQKILSFIWDTLLKTLNIRLDELDSKKVEEYLTEQVEQIINHHQIKIDNLTKNKIMYYIKRESLGYGKIDPLMKDSNIEDISCDGSGKPIFLYHKTYGSLKSDVEFNDEEELSYFVVRLAQKCGKHISIAEPMLDATMPDGSRIQMTLSTEITTNGSTFTIRRFRADPFTPPDLVASNTVSAEILAYMWLAIENRFNALIAGGTASGKTTILNALSLFIPREAKIVSIEETREINLPHPNWIPGIARSGFGEIIADKMVGEIDTYDLMKAALRQRPEYIIVGEIRGKEAYVLFQAMATGHATYSTVHADSVKSLIHRLEGKPIEIPRIMLQSLNIVSIHIRTQVKDKRVRRCKQVIEIVDIDPITKEILTNEVFHWDPVDDKFIYNGKSYILEDIRAKWDLTKEQITMEFRQRVEILEWMKDNEIRTFKEVARAISAYTENPKEFLEKIRKSGKKNILKNNQELKNEEESKSYDEKFEKLDEELFDNIQESTIKEN
jgi:flagellar protein FlaI